MGNDLTTRISDINVNCDITKEDLVAIAVSKHEQELFARQDALSEEIDELNKTVQALQKDRVKHAERLVDAKFAKQLKAVVANLKALGFGSPTAEARPAIAPVRHGSEEECIAIAININDGTGGYNRNISRSEQMPFDPQLVELTVKLGQTSDRLEAVRSEAVKVRKELSKISTMERQARATLAMNVLNSSEEGRQLLAGLDVQKALTGGK